MFACSSCGRGFDLVATVPLILQCGHTFCRPCIKSSVDAGGKFECLDCNFFVQTAEGLIVNRAMCERPRRRMEPPRTSPLVSEPENQAEKLKKTQLFFAFGDPSARFTVPEDPGPSSELCADFSRLFGAESGPKSGDFQAELPSVETRQCSASGCSRLTDSRFCSEYCRQLEARLQAKNQAKLRASGAQAPVSASAMKPSSAVRFGAMTPIKGADFAATAAKNHSFSGKNLAFFSAGKQRDLSPFFADRRRCAAPGCPNPSLVLRDDEFEFCGKICAQKMGKAIVLAQKT